VNILFLDALREGELDAAKELYRGAKKGSIDVNTANKDGLTGLHEAATNNDLKTLEYLVGLGANLECRDVEGWTPLHLASQWEHMDCKKIVSFKIKKIFFFCFSLMLTNPLLVSHQIPC